MTAKNTIQIDPLAIHTMSEGDKVTIELWGEQGGTYRPMTLTVAKEGVEIVNGKGCIIGPPKPFDCFTVLRSSNGNRWSLKGTRIKSQKMRGWQTVALAWIA